MAIHQYIVDAFTSRMFSGNQAAVCVLDGEIKPDLMQNIAVENNFSETAFAVRIRDGAYGLRWFTPGGEIDLCGHATLGTAFVIMTQIDPGLTEIDFSTRSGRLTVRRDANLFTMNFPQMKYRPVGVTDEMSRAIGTTPTAAFLRRDLLMVLGSEREVRDVSPDMDALKRLPGLLQAVTARSDSYDCVSRIFAPKLGVAEDPVTGSTHCMIAPYWSDILGKKTIRAFQASRRGGMLVCEITDDDRVDISGQCVLFAKSSLFVD